MGCATCGKKYPRSSNSSLGTSYVASIVKTLTRDEKNRAVRGVIKKMKTSSPSKGMIQPQPDSAVPGTKPDCGPIIPTTGQPEAWVTSGTQGDTYAGKMESPMNTTLTVDNRAQGKVDE